MTGQTVLVTGAGCLGTRLIGRLNRDGFHVKALDRSPQRLESLENTVEKIAADILDKDALSGAFSGCDYIVHTAAALEGSVEQLYRVNCDGVENVMFAAAEAKVKRIVHISSNAVYGVSQTQNITEDMGPSPSGQAYSRSKAAGEQIVRELGKAYNLSYSIIRPAAIFGPGAQYFTGSYFKRAQQKPILFTGRGQGALHVIFVDDVVDLAILALTHPGAEASAFNCVLDPPPTHKEYLQTYADLVGNRRWLHIPMPLIKAFASLVVPFAKPQTYAKEMPQNLAYMERYVRIRGTKAKNVLGWTPKTDLKSGVQMCVPWLKAQGLLD
jgi:nucleoside-diphosphate-sugar epimerase